MAPIVLLSLVLGGCAPPYADIPVKLVGVGYDPSEIGRAPTPYSGVVEYSWVNFAGGGLSLALMQLGSFAEITASFAGLPYTSPFAAVYGFSYMFDTPLAAADSLAGITAVPPDVEGACYTTYSASGPVGSSTTVDVGSRLEFNGVSGTEGFSVDRYPYEYPQDAQDSFVYYLGFDAWRPRSELGYIAPEGATELDELEPTVVRKANFPFGRTVKFSFPGGVAPAEAPVASLPRHSDSVAGQKSFELPSQPGGVRMSWDGVVYDTEGKEEDTGGWSTCLAFSVPVEAPLTAEDCHNAISEGGGGEDRGQIYTGPWDTNDGKVLFEWEPGAESGADEAVTISVRFLGPVDREESYYKQRMAKVPATSAVIEAGGEGEFGIRTANACEVDDVVWEFDPSFLTGDDGTELIPSLRGDPYNNVAEVTCRLTDSAGKFELTNEVVGNALDYARRHGAEGAVFYFARSTEMDFTIPPVMDNYGNRRDTAPVKVASRAVEIGRFWLESN